jgi:rhomboid protease GluP
MLEQPIDGVERFPAYHPAVYDDGGEPEPTAAQSTVESEEPEEKQPRFSSDSGFTTIVIWGCITIYIATLLFNLSGIRNNIPWEILSPDITSLFVFGASGSIPIFQLGRWWTVLSAGWLHGNLLHIAFNLIWVRELAPPVGHVFGAGRLAIIYTVSTAIAALLSSLMGKFLPETFSFLRGADITVGASGAIFGLLGALVSYGQVTKNDALRKQAFSYVVAMFVFGFLMPNVDNWGHLGGFLGGYLTTKLPGIRPQTPEGRPQRILAIVCLALIALSLGASVFHALYLLK